MSVASTVVLRRMFCVLVARSHGTLGFAGNVRWSGAFDEVAAIHRMRCGDPYMAFLSSVSAAVPIIAGWLNDDALGRCAGLFGCIVDG